MDLRILMIGDDPCSVLPDVQFLRDKGFRVYTVFNYENIADVQREIKPHISFFNIKNSAAATDILATTNDMEQQGSAIYTVKEDDAYMIVQSAANRKRKRVMLADSLITAIKTALGNIIYTPKIPLHHSLAPIHLYTVSA